MMKPRLAEGRGPAQSAQLGNSHRDKLTLAEDGHTCQAFSKPFAFTKAPPHDEVGRLIPPVDR